MNRTLVAAAWSACAGSWHTPPASVITEAEALSTIHYRSPSGSSPPTRSSSSQVRGMGTRATGSISSGQPSSRSTGGRSGPLSTLVLRPLGLRNTAARRRAGDLVGPLRDDLQPERLRCPPYRPQQHPSVGRLPLERRRPGPPRLNGRRPVLPHSTRPTQLNGLLAAAAGRLAPPRPLPGQSRRATIGQLTTTPVEPNGFPIGPVMWPPTTRLRSWNSSITRER